MKPWTLEKVVVDPNAATQLVGDSRLAASDLVPGRYEGGLKLWEGAIDLASELLQRFAVAGAEGPGGEGGLAAGAAAPLAGKRVLELGCGHGLPGIVTLLLGADCVFHDFNEEVLQTVTCPNVTANLRARGDTAGTSAAYRFASGDFESVGAYLAGEGLSFDYILTSESIYNPKSASQLLRACKQCLKADGTVYVAAKSHYFGVGGGLAAFKRQVDEDGSFDLQVVWASNDGASNMREILALARTKP